jgi:hypothetical protein
MTFVCLVTVFRCSFDRLKVDYLFPPEPRLPDADPEPLASAATTRKLNFWAYG